MNKGYFSWRRFNEKHYIIHNINIKYYDSFPFSIKFLRASVYLSIAALNLFMNLYLKLYLYLKFIFNIIFKIMCKDNCIIIYRVFHYHGAIYIWWSYYPQFARNRRIMFQSRTFSISSLVLFRRLVSSRLVSLFVFKWRSSRLIKRLGFLVPTVSWRNFFPGIVGTNIFLSLDSSKRREH